MSSQVTLRVNGATITVPEGASVAVAMALAANRCRRSVTGEPRGPLCGMGICFECRAIVDGIHHSRSCQIQCSAGMEVKTDE